MDQSLSESDISLSPSQLLERLQLLRQLQLMQRGKLHKQRLEYQESPECSPKLSDIVSHFTTSTSYETFRSLLQSTGDNKGEETPPHTEHNMTKISEKVKEQDLVDGVAILNISQESEFIVNSSFSSRSKDSARSKADSNQSAQHVRVRVSPNTSAKKLIELDEMPILTPKKDFETLVIEKLNNEKRVSNPVSSNVETVVSHKGSRPFLRRGEGMARFGLRKNDLVIQPTKSLPWKRKSLESKSNDIREEPVKSEVSKKQIAKDNGKVPVEIPVPQKKKLSFEPNEAKPDLKVQRKSATTEPKQNSNNSSDHTIDSNNCEIHCAFKHPSQNLQVPALKKNQITKHPLFESKGKTWAAVLTNEQGDFLRKLKQTDYYKNYTSPAKSTASDMSCDDNLIKLRQEREAIEQNMFDFLENKVTHESFSLENSFFRRFLQKDQMECSGESTPLVLQKCLAKNPYLLHLQGLFRKKHCEITHSDVETNDSEYTDCDHETCSSVSECCSCKTIEEVSQPCENEEKCKKNSGHQDKVKKVKIQEVDQHCVKKDCHEDTVKENDTLKENMAEMNAKLVATSELLKERLRELEEEIESFRKENNDLARLREEVDHERQQFYKDKANFEQKFNEEKILSEYFLSEEKEKLEKQKQVYERYVREMRGRLNKKDKDEVVNLKREVSDLKEEIRIKDAKSTTTIARLRNQLKIAEKEKAHLKEEIEKLQKANRRLHHSNEMTRRMTNIKYLQEINKKLHGETKNLLPEVHIDSDGEYKGFEIERQCRARKLSQPPTRNAMRTRSKSVPNLNITSRYAKYFSQRDALSQMDENKTLHIDHFGAYGDSDDGNEANVNANLNDSGSIEDNEGDYDNEVENNLEKLYNERFKSTSPRSSKSSLSDRNSGQFDTNNEYFLRKSASGPSEKTSTSPRSPSPPLLRASNESRSPVPVINQRMSNMDQDKSSDYHTNKTTTNISAKSQNSSRDFTTQEYHPTLSSNQNTRSKSPVSILSNRSSGYQRPITNHRDTTRVIDPSSSKSSLSKTSLNPSEIVRPDGTRELRFPNGNVKYIAPDGKYTKFVYYNGDVKENFYHDGTIKYFYAETKTYHTTHPDGLEVLEFSE